jgi:hypothetical protein
MIITNITNETRHKATKFIKEMGEKMSIGNTDGLGYAALDTEGNLFGERWFSNKNAFKRLKESPFGNVVTIKNTGYNAFGSLNLEGVSSMLLHTRFATCEKSLQNVHPFVKDDMALIHNGIIRNPKVYEPTISTCDSEALLNGYLEYNLVDNPEDIEEMVKPLEGYWATALYAKLNGKYILDIFKFGASLDVMYIHDLESWVFTTNGYDMESICDKLGFKYTDKGEVLSNVHIRIDPKTGEVLFTNTYKKLSASEKRAASYYSYENYQKESGTRPYSEWEQDFKKREEPKAVVEVITTEQFHQYVHGIK